MSQSDNNVSVTVIGASVMDVLAGPVDLTRIKVGSLPMDTIRISYGGDALNESAVLSKLGTKVDLISKVGADDTGDSILSYLKELGVSTEHIKKDAETPSSVNVVLVDGSGERYFLTDPKTCLRRLYKEDILPYLDDAADIISFASIFVSPVLTIEEMETLFQKIKEKPGRILTCDMTKAKKGETLEDLARILPYVDYIFPNESEIALLTGCDDPYQNAEKLVSMGVKTAVVKVGKQGCIIRTEKELLEIPAYPIEKAVDTTGAGDSFAGGFLYGLAHGMSLADCGRMACAVASLSVEKVGATTGITGPEEALRRMKTLCKTEVSI